MDTQRDKSLLPLFLIVGLIVILVGTSSLISFLFNGGSLICDSYRGPVMAPPEIPPFHWKKTGLVTLWFDDAWVSQFTVAAPIMEEAGVTGAVAVAIKFVCHSGFMNWDQLRTLQSKGWEITAHSVTHNCDVQYYTPQKIQEELVGSKRLIEARGLRADQFVMPCGYSQYDFNHLPGDFHPQIVPIAKKYFSSYRTTDGIYLNTLPVTRPYELQAFEIRNTTPDEKIIELVQEAAGEKRWLILVFHQVDDSNHIFAVSSAQFKRILDIIKDSGLPVVLPAQALAIK